MKNARIHVIAAALIFAAAAGIYAGTSRFGFTWDDSMVLNDARAFTSATEFKRAVSTPVDRLLRPLRTLDISFEKLFFNENPAGYHACNVLLYALCCILFYWLACVLFGETAWLAAFCAAMLFTAHPLHAEVVSSISNGRADLLCGIFTFSCLAAFASNPDRLPNYVFSLALFLLALLSKESSIVIPAAVFALVFIKELNKNTSMMRAAWSAALSTAPFALIAFFYLVVRSRLIGGAAQASAFHGGGLKSTLLTSASIIPDYFVALGSPVKQCAIYVIPAVHALSAKSASGFFILILSLIIAAIFIRRSPVISFAALLAVLTWLPSSSIIPIATLKAARFMFLPSAGVCLIIAALLYSCAARFFSGAKIARLAAAAATAVLCCLFAFGAVHASSVWKNGKSLWSDTVSCAPHSSIAWNNYGKIASDEGRAAEAEKAFKNAIAAVPVLAQPYENLAAYYGSRGRYADSLNILLRSRSAGAAGPFTDCRIGLCLKKLGREAEAKKWYSSCAMSIK